MSTALASPVANDGSATDAAQMAADKRLNNADYLARCVPQVAVCPPTNGGITQAFVVGTTLYYNLPTADNAMCSDLLFTVNVTVTTAAGTSAVYTVNAGVPWTLIDRIIITYNGTQVQLRPIFLKYYHLLRGYLKIGAYAQLSGVTAPSAAGGGSIATLQAYLFATTIPNPGATVTGATNVVWAWVFRLPLRALHELNHAGVLPIMGQGTKGQVAVVTAPGLFGYDPILNILSTSSGTGQVVTITGTSTVKVEAIYQDGTTFWSPTPLVLDLIGEPTAQWYIDLPMPNVVAGQINRQAITTLLQHYLVLSLALDGNQSNKFSAISNIAELEFDKDSVGRNPFYIYGATTNVNVYDFFERLRQYIGQDLDEGVIPWIVAWAMNQTDSDLREGVMVLNMTSGGWTDAHYGIQFTTVTTTNLPPRLDTYLVSLNPEPLIKS